MPIDTNPPILVVKNEEEDRIAYKENTSSQEQGSRYVLGFNY